MKFKKLNEESNYKIFGSDGSVLKTQDQIDKDVEEQKEDQNYNQSSKKIMDKILSNEDNEDYSDEQLMSDVSDLIDLWQKGR